MIQSGGITRETSRAYLYGFTAFLYFDFQRHQNLSIYHMWQNNKWWWNNYILIFAIRPYQWLITISSFPIYENVYFCSIWSHCYIFIYVIPNAIEHLMLILCLIGKKSNRLHRRYCAGSVLVAYPCVWLVSFFAIVTPGLPIAYPKMCSWSMVFLERDSISYITLLYIGKLRTESHFWQCFVSDEQK